MIIAVNMAFQGSQINTYVNYDINIVLSNKVKGCFIMSEHIYKIIEVVGSSTVSSDDAIRQAVAKSGKSLRNLDWFEVVETRGHIVDAKVAHFQVKIKIGFRLD